MKENALSLLQTLLPLKSTNQRERRPKLFIGLSPSNHTVETRHIIIIIIISLTENRVETGFLAPTHLPCISKMPPRWCEILQFRPQLVFLSRNHLEAVLRRVQVGTSPHFSSCIFHQGDASKFRNRRFVFLSRREADLEGTSFQE